jgi:hypothetical protein
VAGVTRDPEPERPARREPDEEERRRLAERQREVDPDAPGLSVDDGGGGDAVEPNEPA